MTTRRLLAGCATLAILVGCTATRTATDDTAADTVSPTPVAPSADPAPAPVEVPDTPAGEALGWVLAQAGRAPTEETVRERFSDHFLESLAVRDVRAVFATLGPSGAVLEVVHGGVHELAVLAVLGDEVVQIQLVVEAEPPHRMDGLLFTPAIPSPVVPTSLDGAAEIWEGLAPRAALLVAQVVNGECRAVASTEPDRPGPVGSTAKLYVVAAVAAAVDAGTLSWDQPVPIRDEWKSHPSGTYQLLPAGTERTVLELATAMIIDSDNTATDHLVHLVGRQAVESALVELGHEQPELNRPFLTTREMFVIKLGGVDDDELSAFLGGDEARRRALLDEWSGRPLPGLEAFSPLPVLVDEVEWFASPSDLCRAMVHLGELAEWPGLEPLGGVLTAREELVEVDPTTTVWFKGGSEPGVLNLTIRLDDGDRAVIATGTLTDPATVRVPAGGALRWLAAVGALALG